MTQEHNANVCLIVRPFSLSQSPIKISKNYYQEALKDTDEERNTAQNRYRLKMNKMGIRTAL